MSFMRFLVVGFLSGLLFAFMDSVVNQNNLAHAMFEYYKTIARAGMNINIIIGVFILYGFALTWIFEVLYKSLPGKSGFSKGTSFGLLIWFFKVFMYAMTQWMIIPVPVNTLGYILSAGLAEMLLLGWFYGLLINPEEHVSKSVL